MAITDLRDRIEPLLRIVERPSRYIASEFGRRAPTVTAEVSVGLCYPATYEVGQANQALQILYSRLSQDDAVAVERVYLPWIDMIAEMRARDIPLFTLESYRPVSELDILGITMPNEMTSTSILEVLDLAGMPLHADKRDESHPLVIGGGPCAFNPEPMTPFFDAFFIGEADTAIDEVVSCVREAKMASKSRGDWLAALAAIDGIYVPALYDARKDAPITKRLERDFEATPIPQCTLMPFVDVVHDRFPVEILRGCNRGCRFCQAGMVYRPTRERSADTVIRSALVGSKRLGYDEISLTSLSTTDHSEIADIVRRLNAQLADEAVSVSLPSLRVDTFSIDLMNVLLGGAKRPGLTLAPEAGTQRMRDIINKNVTEEQILDTVRVAFESGYRRVKLYFMIGLPHETDEDVVGIADLVKKVTEVALDSVDPRQKSAVKVSLSVNAFVPKAHTPFQWEAQDEPEEIERKQQLLVQALPAKRVQISYPDAEKSFVEGLIARGDRQIAPVIEEAWRSGALFEAYGEHFDFEKWREAFEKTSLNLERYTCARPEDEALPWAHINIGVDSEYLLSEARAALAQKLTGDCTRSSCTGCNACSNLDASLQIMRARA